jgi:hypothetical protein
VNRREDRRSVEFSITPPEEDVPGSTQRSIAEQKSQREIDQQTRMMTGCKFVPQCEFMF